MSGYSEEKASASRIQPSGMGVSDYTLKQLKQEAINSYFEKLRNDGTVSMYVKTEEVDGITEIRVVIKENLYV